MIFVMDMFATPQPTNKIVPTGGVQRPIHKLKIIIKPKCKGSIPIIVIIGKNIGVKIRIAGVISIKVPTRSKIIFIIKSTIIGFSLNSSTAEEKFCGMLVYANTQDNAIEVPISNITTPVVIEVSKKIFGISLILISL